MDRDLYVEGCLRLERWVLIIVSYLELKSFIDELEIYRSESLISQFGVTISSSSAPIECPSVGQETRAGELGFGGDYSPRPLVQFQDDVLKKMKLAN